MEKQLRPPRWVGGGRKRPSIGELCGGRLQGTFQHLVAAGQHTLRCREDRMVDADAATLRFAVVGVIDAEAGDGGLVSARQRCDRYVAVHLQGHGTDRAVVRQRLDGCGRIFGLADRIVVQQGDDAARAAGETTRLSFGDGALCEAIDGQRLSLPARCVGHGCFRRSAGFHGTHHVVFAECARQAVDF